ncbi:MAG: class I SAM-dependent methyltransferase [Cyanobacteria bacterium P01_G01_bin.67]
MKQKDLNQEWIDLSKAWIEEARKGKNPTRNGLLDKPMLIACGDVTGKKIIDCGCGEGRFCRILAARGANYVLGIDLCEPMIEAARELQSETDEYCIADVQDISFIENEMFDLAVSYLNQCDVPNLNSNNQEVYRILNKGGRFIVANLHPMRSAVGAWHRSNSGKKEHVILDRYFDEGDRTWKMMGSEVTNFHRTLSTYISGFLNAGFTIEGIVEPTVIGEQLKDYPELDDELRVPNFIIYILKKI